MNCRWHIVSIHDEFNPDFMLCYIHSPVLNDCLFQVSEGIFSLVRSLSAKVDVVHVIAVVRRIDEECPELHAHIQELNKLLQKNARIFEYNYHAVSSKLNSCTILKEDGVHLTKNGVYNFQALVKAKIIRKF